MDELVGLRRSVEMVARVTGKTVDAAVLERKYQDNSVQAKRIAPSLLHSNARYVEQVKGHDVISLFVNYKKNEKL